MVYLYKKRIGNKDYYYLRVSLKKGNKAVTKDIAYLGNNLADVKEKMNKLPKKYTKKIRKAYKTIKKFIEVNYYIEKIHFLKLKSNPYINRELFENIEACKLHWEKDFKKLDELTKNETLKNFIIEFAYNTTTMEGNTITLKEAEKLLIENRTPKDRTLREIYDLQNTEKVFFDLWKNLNKKITHKLIIKIHDDLLEKIDIRKGYRTADIRVFRSAFKSTPAEYVKIDMDLLLKWYNENEKKFHPLVLATIFHHKFEKIHPFMDGNGRTGRMLMNNILMSKGCPPIMFRNKNRIEYINNLRNLNKIGLNETSVKSYKDLVEFSAKELIDSYWNLFL